MDFDEYQREFFIRPTPIPRFPFTRIGGVTITVERFEEACAFYRAVLGPPAFVEGAEAVGWPLADAWLTLLPGRGGSSAATVSMTLEVATAAEADRLQQTFVHAGATASPARNTFMYEQVRFCPVTDPFGTEIIIVAPLPSSEGP